MTRLIHDEFAKDYLEELLKNYGTITANFRVRSEKGEIDLFFQPSSTNETREIAELGLLGRMAQTAAIFEPFRNPATADQIGDCLVKSLQVRQKLRREAVRNKTKIEDAKIPRLWILTPTESETILSQFPAREDQNWLPGIYFLGSYFTTAIVVIHQLPVTPETLWLRVLGRGKVQAKAIDDLKLLSDNNPFRSMSLKLLYNLEQNLEQNLQENQSNLDEENRELIMRLKPLYERDRELAVQQGLQQERRQNIESLLITRFGSLDESLVAIITPISALSPAEFTPLLFNLSREELLARFANQQE